MKLGPKGGMARQNVESGLYIITSSSEHDKHTSITPEMFMMLCDQVAMLADTQTRDRERMERDNWSQAQNITTTMQRMSESLAAL